MKDVSEAEVEAILGEPLTEEDRVTLKSLQDFTRTLVFHMAEQTAAISRWLLASLLAVNGGAIVAAVNSTEIGGANERLAIVAWIVGIILALGSGLVSMHNGRRGVAVGSEMLAKVTQSLQLGAWQDLRFDDEQREIERRTGVAIGVGVLSEIAFVVGAILAAT